MATAIAEIMPSFGAPPLMPVEVQDVSNLADKTVFLKVQFGMLGNSRKVADPVLTTDANTELLKVSKTLLDSEELEALRKADGKMRTYLDNTCLPYDIGIKLLPCGLIETVQTRLAEYQKERGKYVAAFVAAYPKLCAVAAQQLGSLYNADDYPSADVIADKFYFRWQYVSFGVPGQLKGISAGLFQAEQEKAAAAMKEATEEITLLMRQTLHEMVAHLAERLTPGPEGKAKVLRESAVNNLQEFLSTFDLRNVTDDQQLAAQVAKAKALLTGTNAEQLRHSETFREKIRAGMAGIGAQLSGMVDEKAGRKFRVE